MFRLIPKKVNNSIQKVPMNLPSRSLRMLVETLHNFTTSLKNSCVVNLAEQSLLLGIKGAYFENRSMITRLTYRSPTYGRCVIKSIETPSHGLVKISKGLRCLATFAFLTLSCWQMRHVFAYCMMSSHMLGEK